MTGTLSWSLFGVVQPDDILFKDKTSTVIARVLYALFLILAVIMLVNLMVALLSNTYQDVQVALINN